MPQLPKLTLYTANPSVYGQRVVIVLRNLQIPYEEVVIPLEKPREQWYLEINPRGMVPALKIEDPHSGAQEIVVESALICQVLLELAAGWGDDIATRASEVRPQGHDLAAVMTRYRQDLFLDTQFEKLRVAGRSILVKRNDEALEEFVAAAKAVNGVCPQPGNYFDNSKTITFVEVLTGPWLMRVDAHWRWGLIPNSGNLSSRVQAEAPNMYAWMKKLAEDEKVKVGTWDEEFQRKYQTALLAKIGPPASK